MSDRSRLPRWAALAPAAAYYAGVFCLSAQSRLPSVFSFRLSDKLLHALAFAGFGVLLAWGFGRALAGKPRAAVRAAILTGCAGGVLDEIHQIFVPGRLADPWDAAADILGVLAAIGILALRGRRRPAA